MIAFIIRAIVTVVSTAGTLYVTAMFLSERLGFGITPLDLHYPLGLLVMGTVFWIINEVLGSFIKIFSFPLKILTLGLSSVIINLGLLYLFQHIVNNVIDIQYTVQLGTVVQTFLLSIALSVLTWLIRFIIKCIF